MPWVGISSAQDQQKWTGHLEFFAKPGSDRSIAKGDLFLPLQQNEDFLLFGNLKANFDDQSYKEGNAGIGARKLYDNWIVGGWVFYDWKESSTSNTFDQMTVGGEFLSNDWDLRANAYFAENKVKDSDDASVVELNGNQIQARLGEERALPGFDVEVGRKLPFLEDSRFFVGGYHYDASGFEKVSGPRLRLEMRFHDLPLFSSFSKGSRLTLGAEYTEDSVRGSETFGLLQLRIPFGGKGKNKRSLTSLERRMVETIQRDDDIITSERAGDELMPMVNPKTGQVISVVEKINGSTTNVAATVTAAGQNSLIIADGTQGGINVGSTTINTQPGQIIAGGGQQISLQARKANGGLINMVYTPSGQRPNINRTGSGELIYVNNDDNVTINGVDLAGGRPVRINNSQNVCVLNTNVLSSAANRQAVYVHTNSNVRFENLNIMSSGREGVLVTSNSTANFTNLSVSNTGREGVYLTSNSSAVFNNLSIRGTTREGFELANATAVLRDVNISNTNREGMRMRSGSTVTADNLVITKSGSEAIEVNNSTLNLSNASIIDIDVNANRDGIYATNGSMLNLNNIVIDNVTSQGIITRNTTSSITNVTIRNTAHQGLFAYNNSTANLDNVVIDNAGSQGVYTRDATFTASNLEVTNANNQGLFLYNTTATINDLQINNVGQQGIYLYNNTDATIDSLSINNSAREGLYVRDSDLTLNNASISNITAVANRDGIFIYRNSNVNMSDVSVTNVTGDGMQVQGTSTIRPNVTVTNLSISDVSRFGVVNTRGSLTLNNAAITDTVFDGILVNRGDLSVNTATVSNIGRFGIYALRSNAVIQDLTVSNTASDGVLVNRSTFSLDNSTIRNVGDGNTSDDAIQVINSTLAGAGNRIEGAINNGVACRSSGANTGSIGFSFGPITSCP